MKIVRKIDCCNVYETGIICKNKDTCERYSEKINGFKYEINKEHEKECPYYQPKKP